MARIPFRFNPIFKPNDPGISFEPLPINGRFTVLEQRSPLLLMPLRLEYRLVKAGQEPTILKPQFEQLSNRFGAMLRTGQGLDTSGLQLNPAIKDAFASETNEIKRKAETLTATLAEKRELWFRWYPDSDLAQSGMRPPDPVEAEALETFVQATQGRDWWDASDTVVREAFGFFARVSGPARAVHLIRTRAGAPDTVETRLGRITALPQHVALFAVKDEAVSEIAKGADIPPNWPERMSAVSYGAQAIEPGGWLSEFDAAIALGMGVKITEKDLVEAALDADWIIAVGLHKGQGVAEVAALMEDGIANGKIAVLAQDSPTNNTPGSRTPMRSFRDEADAYLTAATAAERDGFADGLMRGADLLTEALGLPDGIIQQAVLGAETGFEDARAMLRVLGPALLDGSLDKATWVADLSENDVIDVLATGVVARGLLPAMRFKNSAYGIVTVTDNAAIDPDRTKDFSDAERKVIRFLNFGANISKKTLRDRAQQSAPVLEPDAPDVAERLEAILQNARVSRRLEIADKGSDKTKALGCAYVRGRHPEHRPTAYLARLRQEDLTELPDPTAQDDAWPLLYRLARLSLTGNLIKGAPDLDVSVFQGAGGLATFEAQDENQRVRALDDISSVFLAPARRGEQMELNGVVVTEQVQLMLRRIVKNFDDALARLLEIAKRPDGDAALETLMLEVFDLFQHRVDAWATGVAALRLRRMRQSGDKGLAAGYWGVLGKLRDEAETRKSDGYLQAPSLAQATTAAVLRSADLRHPNGAFDLDLSSARVRRGMSLLDLLAANTSLPIALGIRAERYLRELPENRSDLLPMLRGLFPVTNVNPPEIEQDEAAPDRPIGAPRLNGLALTNINAARVPTGLRHIVEAIQPRLRDDFDAISDIIMAEAAHQQTMGAVEAANAWVQVLSGGGLPGRPGFLATQRAGQGSTHRIVLLVPASEIASDPRTTSIRALREPTVAALAEQAVPAPDALRLKVDASARSERAESASVFLTVGDLGMSAIDLMIGGISEVEVRARAAFQAAWWSDEGLARKLSAAQGAAPLGRAALGGVVLSVDLEDATRDALSDLAALRTAITSGRPLEAADLNDISAADKKGLPEAEKRRLVKRTIGQLDHRIAAVSQEISQAATDLDRHRVAIRNLVVQLRKSFATPDATPDDPSVARDISTLEQHRVAFVRLLPRIAELTGPAVLRHVPSLNDLLTDPTLDEHLQQTLKTLSAKVASLTRVQSVKEDDAVSLQAAINRRCEALKAVVDGDALPVLLPIERTSATTPDLSTPQAASGLLAPLTNRRVAARQTDAALGALPDYQGHVLDHGGADTDTDPRDEARAPRAKLSGVVLATSQTLETAPEIAGIMLDEWVETRASTRQNAAVAFHYNGPQAEAPNALILAVPPNPTVFAWSDKEAAMMVANTLDWMQARALPTAHKMTPAAMMPDANVVPPKGTGADADQRLPGRRFNLFNPSAANMVVERVFVEGVKRADEPDLSLTNTGLNVTKGWSMRGLIKEDE